MSRRNKIKAWGVFINTGQEEGKIKGHLWALGVYATEKYAQIAAKEETGRYKVLPIEIYVKEE